MTARLNVNIDHVATVRQARRAPEPSIVAAAMIAEHAGADGLTIHLRGDRRHIQDADVRLLRDDMDVVAAMVRRLDHSIARLETNQALVLDELRAMHAQQQRTAARVRALEEQGTQ